jgi:hypothetical protein
MSVYLIATMQLKSGQTEAFNDTMTRVVPMLEHSGWKLASSYQHLIGDFGTVVNVWELPDANAFSDGLARNRSWPGYAEIIEELTAEVARESVRLAVKSPFSP